MNDQSASSRRRWTSFAFLIAAAAGITWWFCSRTQPSETVHSPTGQPNSVIASSQPASATPAQTNQFHASTAFEWTSDNAKDTNVIRRLAHNDLEYARMVNENPRVFRRQLVRRKETVAALIEQAKLTGEPIRQLLLPGLDGKEISFEITQADVSPSGQQGTFAGHVAGQADSTVTLAFKGGREAFMVISPSENLYLFGEPHEPGEIIVKSVDITQYPMGDCGVVVMSNSQKHETNPNENQR